MDIISIAFVIVGSLPSDITLLTMSLSVIIPTGFVIWSIIIIEPALPSFIKFDTVKIESKCVAANNGGWFMIVWINMVSASFWLK